MANTTRGHEVVRLRISPALLARVNQYAKDSGVTNQSGVLRDLVEMGLDSADAQKADGKRVSAKPYPGRAQVAERAAFLVELLGDLMQEVERHDPQGAELLSAGLLKAVSGYDHDLKKRVK